MDNLEIENVDVVLNPGRSGELTAMLAEFKIALNDYLKELVVSPVRSLADVIAFNKNHPDLVTILFSTLTFYPRLLDSLTELIGTHGNKFNLSDVICLSNAGED